MLQQFYPVRDRLSVDEVKALGLLSTESWKFHEDVRAIVTDEFREVKKGEWYLSGAVPEAYKAQGDSLTKFRICRLVRIRTRIITEIVCEMPALPK